MDDEEDAFSWDASGDGALRRENFAHAFDDDEEDGEDGPQAAAEPLKRSRRMAPMEPNHDVHLNRPEYVVTDAVSDYNLGSLMVLLYAHVTEGISTPVIFDGARQRLVTDSVTFDFS